MTYNHTLLVTDYLEGTLGVITRLALDTAAFLAGLSFAAPLLFLTLLFLPLAFFFLPELSRSSRSSSDCVGPSLESDSSSCPDCHKKNLV